jgi:predicted AlkP superfamily phosphohydrolase/phosphomutase
MVAEGRMPNMAQLLKEGALTRTTSTYPDVSSVAWASFMTGTNPAKHGIFGFIDRQPGTYKTYIPSSNNMKRDTLWDVVGRQGKRVCAIGVPMSYPPKPVNGIQIGCFLSPNVTKATYPPELGAQLEREGYRVDIDAQKARVSRDAFLEDYKFTLRGRVETVLRLLKQERWDLFAAHFIETDRLHHFLWGEYAEEDSTYYPAFLDCYRQIDEFLGRLVNALDSDTELILLSDHGSCAIKQEFYLAHWLVSEGYLKFTGDQKSLETMDPSSTAYCMDPGRVYLNVRGREPAGSVEPGDAYHALRDEIAGKLEKLTDPGTGDPMVERVLRSEDIYNGPLMQQAPDLVVETKYGYDVKGSLQSTSLTGRTPLTGMHTFDDAMLYLRGDRILREGASITDVMPTILELMNVPPPAGLDGRSCLAASAITA